MPARLTLTGGESAVVAAVELVLEGLEVGGRWSSAVMLMAPLCVMLMPWLC